MAAMTAIHLPSCLPAAGRQTSAHRCRAPLGALLASRDHDVTAAHLGKPAPACHQYAARLQIVLRALERMRAIGQSRRQRLEETSTKSRSMTGFTLNQANDILPLVKAIAAELVERRTERLRALKTKEELEAAQSPEGLEQAIDELHTEIGHHDSALAEGRKELEHLGLTVLRMNPLTIHFPGRAAPTQPVVFCWMEGDPAIDHGHVLGEEDKPRRPLRVRRQGDVA
jgi:hypothetical protein